ncbi:MAG: hypothetical protein IJU76_04895, partial [Desulfovibrionaceae bacterium]|nr:hypothetical protein [Desulfovibrionaceae bacterium]
LNKNSDFYALFLGLKRAKTPMAMREAINKYKVILGKPEHQELLKTILPIIETLYKRFNPDAATSNISFASLEEIAMKMNSAEINWKKNYCEELRNDSHFREELRNDSRFREELRNDLREEMKDDLREEIYIDWKNEAKREDALAMLKEGLTLEMIGRITKLSLVEIEKLQAQKV